MVLQKSAFVALLCIINSFTKFLTESAYLIILIAFVLISRWNVTIKGIAGTRFFIFLLLVVSQKDLLTKLNYLRLNKVKNI